MRKLVYLAVLSMTAEIAMAQSSVKLSGLIDLGIARNIGGNSLLMQESTTGNSRLMISGVEDLGAGYAAMFGMETRFRPDTGALAVPDRFWHGFSTVGMKTPAGTFNLGRQYTPAFSMVQNSVDPFGNTTIANLRDVGMRPGAAVHGLSGSPRGVATVTKVRVSDSLRYDMSAGALNFAASVGEKNQEAGLTAGPNKPWSVAATYSTQNLFLGASYENPQFDFDHQWNIGVRYVIDSLTLSAGLAHGRTANNFALRGGLLGASYNIGPGSVKIGYASSKVASQSEVVKRARWATGYHHNLSKRTMVYSDIACEKHVSNRKCGFDLGVVHRF